MAEISLVIINDDAVEYCPQLFDSLQDQIAPELVELIFVDNCSRDDSIKKAREFGVNKIFSFENKVHTRGTLYNKGVELADGKYIIFAHSDIYFAPDFFKVLFKRVKQEQPDFVNFGQHYADHSYFGSDQVWLDFETNKLCYRHLFQPPSLEQVILECSDGCFMIDRTKGVKFSESYYNSLLEFDLLVNIQPINIKTFQECKFTHYFIELHEKIKTLDLDKHIFVSNNESFIFKQLTNQINELSADIQTLNYKLNIKEESIRKKEEMIRQRDMQINHLNALAESLRIKSRIKRFLKKFIPKE